MRALGEVPGQAPPEVAGATAGDDRGSARGALLGGECRGLTGAGQQPAWEAPLSLARRVRLCRAGLRSPGSDELGTAAGGEVWASRVRCYPSSWLCQPEQGTGWKRGKDRAEITKLSSLVRARCAWLWC